jgi:hypothetical protein
MSALRPHKIQNVIEPSNPVFDYYILHSGGIGPHTTFRTLILHHSVDNVRPRGFVHPIPRVCTVLSQWQLCGGDTERWAV